MTAVDEAAAGKGITRNEFIVARLEEAVGWSGSPQKEADPVAAMHAEIRRLRAEIRRLRAELTRQGQRTRAPAPGEAVFLPLEPDAVPVFLQENPQAGRP